MVLLLVFMQLTRDLFAIAKFLFKFLVGISLGHWCGRVLYSYYQWTRRSFIYLTAMTGDKYKHNGRFPTHFQISVPLLLLTFLLWYKA